MKIRRRTWLALVSVVGAGVSTSIVSARDFAPDNRPQSKRQVKKRVLAIRVSTYGMAAIVDAVGGSEVRVQVDSSLAATQMVIENGPGVDISQRILMKGQEPARSQFLDDARNAVRVGINVRNALLHYDPSRKAVWNENQRKWVHPFARKLLTWTRRLESGLKGRSLRDEYHRIYLLEWGGAKIASHGNPTPSSLAKVATGPAVGNLKAYTAYIDALVRAITS